MDAAQVQQEMEDAQKVEYAQHLISCGSLKEAEALLLEVVSRTPSGHFSRVVHETKIFLKCWDRADFEYIRSLQQQAGDTHELVWIPNVYPKAHFYLGLVLMRQKDYEKALQWLSKGAVLEPHSPRLLLDQGRALGLLGKTEQALEMYERVLALNHAILPLLRAAAFRGKAVQLIELGDLNGAEYALLESMKIDPDSPLAANELNYLRQLRQKQPSLPISVVPMALGQCQTCGKPLSEGSGLQDGTDKTVFLCASCLPASNPKWWQFWK